MYTNIGYINWATDPVMAQIIQQHYAYNLEHYEAMVPIAPVQQTVVWDGGGTSECVANAAMALGAYGAGVAACATATGGVGALGCVAAAVGVFGASAAATTSCANASANNGNGSAGPGPGGGW